MWVGLWGCAFVAGLWCSSEGCDPLVQSIRGLSLGKFFRPVVAPAPSPSSRVSRRMLSDPGRCWGGLRGWGVSCVCVCVCVFVRVLVLSVLFCAGSA